MRRWLLGLVLGGGVAGLAYWRRALTADGALAAALMGGLIFVRGGMAASVALLAFFTSSSTLSRLGHRRKAAQAKGARRDAWQVLANGGAASACLLLGGRRAHGGYLGGLATAAADTWATELGMLARTRPRLISTLDVVEPGISGGVTPEGLLASLGGALAVGLGWVLCGGARRGLGVSLLVGLAGSLIDSLLGAWVQARYVCPVCGKTTELRVHPGCGVPSQLAQGQAWVTNDVVNALATAAGALLGSASWERRS